jgi:hypothetical protein
LATTLRKILRNEKYIGDALLQKTVTTDFLTKKRVENKGIVPQYYVEGSHECCPYVNTFEPPQKARKMGVSCEFGIAHPHVEHLKTGRFLG